VRNAALAPEGTEWEDNQRYASLKGIMAAKKKEIREITIASLGLTAQPTCKTVHQEPPPGRKAGVKVASVEELVAKLRTEAKVL
jgi:electron transfer flavoprotein beta subunit